MANYTMSRARPSSNFELVSWFYMRVSGVLIAFFLLGHIVIMHILHHVDEIDYAFAAERFANPFWRIYDLVLLGLVVTHGLSGARTVLDDYVRSRAWRALLKTIMWALGVLFLVVGAFVLFTFQPVTA
jgi:succinate dehydrogenase / fumarate reductase membrane anchor subunit